VDASVPGVVQYDGARFHYVGLLTLRNFYVPLTGAEGAGVVPIDAFVSVAILCDRVKLLAAGGYDPRYFILFEDSDLSYRLVSSGERIAAVEDAIVEHRGGTAGTSFRGGDYPGRRVFLHSRNRWLFLVKNYQLSTLLLGAPGLVLYELAAALFALAKGAPWAYVKGKAAFLAMLPGALADRKATQARRRVPDRAFVRGGPLTLWPPLTSGRAAAALGRGLDSVLCLFWRLTGGRA
jgi:GT2 family glycosyltransferase